VQGVEVVDLGGLPQARQGEGLEAVQMAAVRLGKVDIADDGDLAEHISFGIPPVATPVGDGDGQQIPVFEENHSRSAPAVSVPVRRSRRLSWLAGHVDVEGRPVEAGQHFLENAVVWFGHNTRRNAHCLLHPARAAQPGRYTQNRRPPCRNCD